MQSAIKIYTEAGVQLDVSPTATIELNMGGISLLSLADRTATYTNSFKMPNTPTNTREFGFAGSPNVRDNNSINVVIEKGVFQRKAVLKVVSFDKDYSCSISYDSMIDYLNNLNYYDLFVNKTIKTFPSMPSYEDVLLEVYNTNNESYALSTYGHDSEQSVFTRVSTVLNLIPNVVFDGDVLDDPDFQNLSIYNRNITLGLNTDELVQLITPTTDVIKISSIIKAVCQMFFADIKILGDTIYINKINLSNVGVEVDSFSSIIKNLNPQYGLSNYVKYDVIDKTISENFGADMFISNGIGDKEALKIVPKIPKYYGTGYFGYDMNDEISQSDIVIMTLGGNGNPVSFEDGEKLNTLATLAEPLTMSGYYSTILNPIFEKPIILDATCWLSSLTASNIINNRVISSYQLGGRYWVDSMAHDLNSGKTKMKLIKLK